MATGRFAIYLDGDRLGGRATARVREIEIRQGDDAIGLARVRFALAQAADGTYPLLDDGSFTPGAEVSIALAAPGGTDARVFTGHLAHLRPHFEPIEANAYLDLVAYDGAMLLDAEERVASYPDMSDADAAAEILSRYGITLDADATDAQAAEDDRLLIQRASDWSFLRHLAARNGFVTWFEADEADGAQKCVFGARRLEDEPQADLTILRENANLNWIDFQIAHDRPARRVSAAIDTLAKRIVRADRDSAAPVLGEAVFAAEAEAGLQRAGAAAAVRFLRPPVAADTALNAAAEGAMTEDHLSIEARGELDPGLYRGLLRAHRLALIKGVGDRLSGTWYVTSVRTVMRDGELSQSFVAVTNALGRAGDERFGQSAEEEPPA